MNPVEAEIEIKYVKNISIENIVLNDCKEATMQTNQKLSIIFESSVMSEVKGYEKLPNGQISMKSVLQDVDAINRNTNYYPASVLMEAVNHPRIKELIERKSLFGEISHPWDKKNFSRSIDIFPDNISHRICTLPVLEGKNLVSTVHTVKPRGDTVVSWVCDEGSQLGYSLRGITPYSFEKTNPVKHTVIKSPMSVLTWDIVFFPSHRDALMQVNTESGEKNLVKGSCVEATSEELASYIAMESPTYKLFHDELGIEIDGSSKIERIGNEAAIGLRLKDGRVAKMTLEADILCEVGKFL